METFHVSDFQAAASTSTPWWWWTLIILSLAILGINVFAFLAKGTDWLASTISPTLRLLGFRAIDTVEGTVENALKGADYTGEAVIDVLGEAKRASTPEDGMKDEENPYEHPYEQNLPLHYPQRSGDTEPILNTQPTMSFYD